MNPFTYLAAGSVAEARRTALHDPGARFIAGGTNILDLMKDTVERPTTLVDINALPLQSVELRGGFLHIGALARMSDVARNEAVRNHVPLVAMALNESASPQLRNMASMGGNLLQRTRCPYFRDVAAVCNKRRPGSGCDAIAGENRNEAVLGTSAACIATHASDVAVAFAALDAVIVAHGSSGERQIPIREFYLRPGNTPNRETVLAPGELVTGILVPLLSFARRSTYLKVRDRAQYDFALASAAVALDLEAGTIRQARVALGGIATTPWRSQDAEHVLAGAAVSRATFEDAARAALLGARGFGGNDFKIPLAQRTLVRALEIASSA